MKLLLLLLLPCLVFGQEFNKVKIEGQDWAYWSHKGQVTGLFKIDSNFLLPPNGKWPKYSKTLEGGPYKMVDGELVPVPIEEGSAKLWFHDQNGYIREAKGDTVVPMTYLFKLQSDAHYKQLYEEKDKDFKRLLKLTNQLVRYNKEALNGWQRSLNLTDKALGTKKQKPKPAFKYKMGVIVPKPTLSPSTSTGYLLMNNFDEAKRQMDKEAFRLYLKHTRKN